MVIRKRVENPTKGRNAAAQHPSTPWSRGTVVRRCPIIADEVDSGRSWSGAGRISEPRHISKQD